jgi:hypothetical protein
VTKDGGGKAASGHETRHQPNGKPDGIEQLRTDIEKLKGQLPSTPNWLTLVGTVCGILAALVGIWLGLHTYFWKAPRLSIVAGPTLALRYLPIQHRLSVEWTFSVGNDGDLVNTVSDGAGEVRDSADSSKQVIVFGAADLECTTGQAKVSVPFEVGPGLPVSVTCTASGYLSDRGRSLLADGAPKEFVFSLKGEKQSRARSGYCFDVPDEEASEFRSGGSIISDRFVFSSCEEGAE